MTPLKSLLENSAPPPVPPNPIDAFSARLAVYSKLGIALAVIWLLINRPFWRHLFIALSTMMFATLLLPTEMMFFVRHPILAFAILFAAGFAGANLGKSGIGTAATWAVVVVLAVAAYRIADDDPVTGPWLRSQIGASVSSRGSTLESR